MKKTRKRRRGKRGEETQGGKKAPGDGKTPPEDGKTPPKDGKTPPEDGKTPPDGKTRQEEKTPVGKHEEKRGNDDDMSLSSHRSFTVLSKGTEELREEVPNRNPC